MEENESEEKEMCIEKKDIGEMGEMERPNKEDKTFICQECKSCGEFVSKKENKSLCTCGHSLLKHLPDVEEEFEEEEDVAEYADDF